MSRNSDSSIEGAVVGGAVLVVILLLILGWLLARATRTIAQAWIAHPRHKAIWIGASLLALSLAGTAATNGDAAFFTLSAASFLALYLVAYVLVIRDHQAFERPMDLSDVIHPTTWWQAA